MIFVLLLALQDPATPPVDFARDVRPILSQHCYGCHGPDRKNPDSDLRFDTREGALQAIVPGRPDRSELYRRVTASDRSERMPPAKTGKKLETKQVEILRRWIAEGAPWQGHWAFIPPVRPQVPAGEGHPVDRFVRARLQREGLRPAADARRETLIRRATLDLTGLPPTVEEAEAFLADARPDAYERLVDRLLTSPRYGERMAMDWLDAARYADTHGLHVDSHRDMWPWRDWVIRAFNANLPFDRFTVEQLAGDLLPDATVEQKLASGFNRNHMISYQGSSVPEKVRVGYIVDRVTTTGTVWLGLTLECAQCHDHKFDPIPQKDFYSLFAFFNSVAEKPLDGAKGNAEPVVLLGAAQSAMVMQDLPKPRETRILERGEYNRPGQRVDPATLSALPAPDPSLPRNRLGLARWLVDPKHPLTARVTVNRLWQMLFGIGLVESAGDFGEQGTPPSHPELFDWLAVEFVESGWDVKAMIRLLVTSSTYRQASEAFPELASRDPLNRLLARGPRVRLPAEAIRDQALAASGLLVEKTGGPSVFPYQPAGVWDAVASQETGKYTAQVYTQSRGPDLWRRSLYTFWKRLAPPPALATFDAPSRETCVVRRPRTNTPLQALVLWNDPTYVEAARALAHRHDGNPEAMFRAVLCRPPSADESAVLLRLLERSRESFRANAAEAKKLLSVGDSPAGEGVDRAAATMVAAAILSLDEAITKE